jgi:hypothetical protein
MGLRVAHAVEVAGQLVVAPAHQHVADIAGDDAIHGLHGRPLLGIGLLAGQHLQPALAGALEQQRQAVEVRMCACAPQADFVLECRVHGKVMQHAQRALVAGHGGVMCAGEELLIKAQLVGKAGQQLHAHLPALMLKGQRGLLEAGQLLLAGPQPCMRGRVT